MLIDLTTWRDVQARRPVLLYWRTASGLEVDFVIETPRRLLSIEVKAAGRVGAGDDKGPEAVLNECPDLYKGGLLLCSGREVFPVTRRVRAVPWWMAC